jgi:hypothetical protein
MLALLAGLVPASGCAGSAAAPAPLRLVPELDAGATAMRLARWREGGPAERLERALALLLLLDDARWRGGPTSPSRRALLEALGLQRDSAPPAGGASLAARAAALIAGELAAVRRLPGVTADQIERAEQARVSLDWDVRVGAAPATPVSALAGPLAGLRREARRRDRAGLFAALRLLGFCLDAFAEARAAPPAEREPVAARCLMALDDTDVTAHLELDPRRRLPSPSARAYGHSLGALLDGHTRPAELHGVGPLVLAARQRTHRALAELAEVLPPGWSPQELRAMGLIELPFAEPFENTPWLRPAAGTPLPSPAELGAMARRDPRGTLIVVLAGKTQVRTLLELAATTRAAAAPGFQRLDLAVSWKPPGGPARLGALPLHLATAAPPAARRVGVALEPGVTLECSPGEVRFRLLGLEEARLRFDASPAMLIAVRQVALRLRERARGLSVVVRASGEVPAAALIKLLAAVRTDDRGQPLLGPLVLAPGG